MFELTNNKKPMYLTDSLFNNFFNDLFINCDVIPHVDYYSSEDNNNYYIEVAVPGLDKKDVNINIDQNYLCLSSEGIKKSGFGTQSFNKRFKLPSNVNQDNITAKLKNGILSITIEKSLADSLVKKIEIK